MFAMYCKWCGMTFHEIAVQLTGTSDVLFRLVVPSLCKLFSDRLTDPEIAAQRAPGHPPQMKWPHLGPARRCIPPRKLIADNPLEMGRASLPGKAGMAGTPRQAQARVPCVTHLAVPEM